MTRIVSLTLLLCTLCACGIKGPLRLPDEQKFNTNAPSPAAEVHKAYRI